MAQTYESLETFAEGFVSEAIRIEATETPTAINEGYAFAFIPYQLPPNFVRTQTAIDPNTGISTYDFKVVTPAEDDTEQPILVDFDVWAARQLRDRGEDEVLVGDVFRLRNKTSHLAFAALRGVNNG